jgi:osmotically-inducible protein OsmY
MRNDLTLLQPVITQVRENEAPSSLDTTVVKQEIEKALHTVEQIDAKRVSVAVEDNFVVLRGDVKTWREHQAAAQAVSGIAGATRVRNELRVAPWMF